MNPEFKNESIEIVAKKVSKEIGCSLLVAVSKMQSAAARHENNELLDDL